jgi:CTP:molybdopterin cytidylyltransferase MocA
VSVGCLVLAAGSSRRLGQPKQLLPYRGRPLLDAVLDTAGPSGPTSSSSPWAGQATRCGSSST